VAAASEADRETAATGMTAQSDRTSEPPAAKEADEVVLELPDISDVAATPFRQIMSAQIGQHHLGRPRRFIRVVLAKRRSLPVCPLTAGYMDEGRFSSVWVTAEVR
jgi:hypothetical protein